MALLDLGGRLLGSCWEFCANDFGVENLWVSGGNPTRKATDDELFERFGLVCCEDGDCRDELDALGVGSLPHFNAMPLSPLHSQRLPPQRTPCPHCCSVLAASFEVLQYTVPLFTPAPELVYNHKHDVVDYIVDLVKLRGREAHSGVWSAGRVQICSPAVHNWALACTDRRKAPFLPGTGRPNKTGRKACDTDVMTLAVPQRCITASPVYSNGLDAERARGRIVSGRPRVLGICLTVGII